MTGALSPTHWLLIIAVLVLLFGAKRLPDLARGVGSSLRVFKAETAALQEENKEQVTDGRTDTVRASTEAAPTVSRASADPAA